MTLLATALLALAGAASAAEAPPAPGPSQRAQALLAGLEGWSLPDADKETALCIGRLGATRDLRPQIPVKEARLLDEVLALHQRSEDFLCGAEPGCGASARSFGPKQCETAHKVAFWRGVLAGQLDVELCRRLAQRSSAIEWPKSMSPKNWAEACRQGAAAILRGDLTVCSKEGALGKFTAFTEEDRRNCESLFFDVDSCPRLVRNLPDGRRDGAADLVDCVANARLKEAFLRGETDRCEGNRLCLAAMREPAACAARYPRGVDILLAEDDSACEGIPACLQAHASAAPFRATNRAYREQMAGRCRTEAETARDRARRERLNLLREAQASLQALEPALSAEDPAAAARARRRIEELAQQADRSIPQGKPPPHALLKRPGEKD